MRGGAASALCPPPFFFSFSSEFSFFFFSGVRHRVAHGVGTKGGNYDGGGVFFLFFFFSSRRAFFLLFLGRGSRMVRKPLHLDLPSPPLFLSLFLFPFSFFPFSGGRSAIFDELGEEMQILRKKESTCLPRFLSSPLFSFEKELLPSSAAMRKRERSGIRSLRAFGLAPLPPLFFFPPRSSFFPFFPAPRAEEKRIRSPFSLLCTFFFFFSPSDLIPACSRKGT